MLIAPLTKEGHSPRGQEMGEERGEVRGVHQKYFTHKRIFVGYIRSPMFSIYLSMFVIIQTYFL